VGESRGGHDRLVRRTRSLASGTSRLTAGSLATSRTRTRGGRRGRTGR
jgi:hypothetical protein